ncbi:hypothetical protein MLD38_004938 [Melastoma candidum]|uniref:Uncharacterized protein n=1 Tax=Melastoma candidum TaxID=119954 RepID=A0ACB9SC72_9MYRT|nr:hypothetical protein MLD38_004938 [Melastoma candidum]
MGSGYRPIPKSSPSNLQIEKVPEIPDDKFRFRFSPLEVENCSESKDVRALDVSYDYDYAPVDIDNYPLNGGGHKSGSAISGAVFNLTTSIIGAGIMALPTTMKVLGLVLGTVLIVLIGILSEISVELLVRFSVFANASSYGEVVQYKIDSLSMTSAASVALAVVFVVVCFIVAFIKIVEGSIESPRMNPDFGSKKAILDMLVVIPIMSNAYVCHFNVRPIYNELEGRSPERMNQVGRITTAICVVVYSSTAKSGYLLFGNNTEADILTNFDKDLGILRFSSALDYIVRIGYILHLVLVFPVIHFPLRQTVDTLLFEGSAPLVDSRKRSLTLTAILLALIYIGSTMIPNIWMAFKFTGATTAVSLGFIFPPLIALRFCQKGASLNHAEKFLSWVMLVLAVIVSIVRVIRNIYSLESQSE